jgi:hypothetical protein
MKELQFRRNRRRGQRSTNKLFYFFGAFILVIIVQLTVSMKILYTLEESLPNYISIHPSKRSDPIPDDTPQQMVILAGPHKTGTSR